MADLIIAHPACSGMFFACDRTKKSFNEGLLVFQSGVPEGTRTPDRALRRRMLYPTELRGQQSMPNYNSKFHIEFQYIICFFSFLNSFSNRSTQRMLSVK